MLNHLRHTKVLFSVLLTCLVLIGSVGISMDVHFCQDEVRSIGILQQADACFDFESTVNTTDCLEHKACEKECCHNKNQLFKSSYENAGNNIAYSLSTGIATTVFTAIETISFKVETTNLFNYLTPSPSSRDILYKKQSWLI